MNFRNESRLLARKLLRAIASLPKLLDAGYAHVTTMSKGKAFAFLFNIRAFINRRPIRVIYLRSQGVYRASSEGLTRFFFDERQNYFTYKRGFRKRAFLLARQYHIDKLTFEPGDLVVDCGANVGDLELYFQFSGIPIRYIGFEPSPNEFLALKMNVSQGNLYNEALWNTNTTLDFYISERNADSSVIEPTSFSSVTKIKCVRLDERVSEPVKLLKLEAEGAEPEVLYGAEKIFPITHYIAVDCGFERGVHSESTLPQVCNFLVSRNFEIVALGRERLTLLFVNKNFIAR